MEIYHALEKIDCDRVGTDHDKEKGPFPVALDINYPVKYRQ